MNVLPRVLRFVLVPLLATSLHAASTYRVKSGDTLSSIARRHGTTAQRLMKSNGITNPNKLRIGQVLTVNGNATPAPTAPVTPRKSGGNYKIQSGETFYSIARKHGLSVSQLSKLNPSVDPARLSVGQKIRTSGATPSKPATPAPKPKPQTVAKQQAPQQSTLPPPPSEPITEEQLMEITSAPNRAPAAQISLQVTEPAPVGPPQQQSPLSDIVDFPADMPNHISSITVNKEISFGALASRHQTTTRQLNELNGWNLRPTTVLAKGSEVYIPSLAQTQTKR